MSRLRWVVVGLALVAAGCGDKADHTDAKRVLGSTGTSAPQGGSSATSTSSPSTVPGQATTPTSRSTTAPGSSDTNRVTTTIPADYRIDVFLKKTCVSPGDTESFQASGAEPKTAVAWTMQYADAQSHGSTGGGFADGGGNYSGTFVVPPDAPLGNAQFAVAGHKNGHSGMGKVLLTVAKRGDC
jgi:hypothetical protein